MNGVRDSQRSKVYSLGTRANRRLASLEECEKLIADAHSRYGLFWRGKVKDGRGTRSAKGNSLMISLPVWARTVETVLHEAAHAIIHQIGRTLEIADHGPEFARVMLELPRPKIQLRAF